MIKVTRINDSILYINPDLIEFLEETPDTVISMTTGKKLLVLEAIPEIQERILAYKKEIFKQFPAEVHRGINEVK